MTASVRPYRYGGLLLAGLVVCSGFAFSQAPSTPTQAPPPTVKLSLLVTDEKNRSVEDVTKDEVQLIEDGQPQVISYFDKDTRLAQYVIAVDSSGSFRGLLEPALNFVKLIIAGKKDDEQIQLIRFISSDKIERVIDYTSDRSKLIDSLKQVELEQGQSAVVDAIYEAVRSVASHRRSESMRRVVIVISDGEDRASYYKTDALVKLLRENDVQVFVVGLVVNLEAERGFSRPSVRETSETLLKTVATESGGRAFFPRTHGDLVSTARDINQHLQTSYVLGFQPGSVDKKGFRKISIKIAKRGSDDLKAITRAGYVVESRAAEKKEKNNRN